MKTRLCGIGIVLVGCAAAIGCVSTGYHETVSVGTTAPAVVRPGGWDQPFYGDLAPYGRWVHVSGPGWVWSPYNVQAGWSPYRLGHWVFTDYGWTWASDEEWGWAVYHYGRWHLDPSYGWVWVPGTEWGPAWVAWHEGGGYVGWAPLPWQVSFRADVGLDWGGVSVTIEPSWWCFAGARHLVDPGLRTHIVPATRNVTLIQVTQNVTNYTYIDNRIVNQGVKVERIGRAVGHSIPRYRVAETGSRETTRGGKVRGNEFVVFRPDPPRGHTSHEGDSHGRDSRDGDSHSRVDPPVRDARDRARDYRPGPARPDPAPPAAQPEEPAPPDQPPATQTEESAAQTEPAQAAAPHDPKPAPPARTPSDARSKSRGRKFLEELTGRQPPRHSPQEAAPPQAPPPQSAASDQPAAAPPAPAEARPSTPPAPAEALPGSPAPGKGQSAKEKAKNARDAGVKARKPKQDAPKADPSEDGESKKEKPDSNP